MPTPGRSRVGAVLLAAGSGARFGKPKQFLQLGSGIRLIDAALATVLATADETVLVLPDGVLTDGAFWDGAPVDAVAPGGASRLASVQRGLAALGPCDIVLVHDAGHPLATVETSLAVVAAIEAGADAAVPFLPVVDVLKRVRHDGSLETAGRDGLGQAQTPHAFRAAVLRALHVGSGEAESATEAWEDTQLIEEQGGRVVGVPGDPGNIHIVTPADLRVARTLFTAARSERPERRPT